jgi:hypothetical protein
MLCGAVSRSVMPHRPPKAQGFKLIKMSGSTAWTCSFSHSRARCGDCKCSLVNSEYSSGNLLITSCHTWQNHQEIVPGNLVIFQECGEACHELTYITSSIAEFLTTRPGLVYCLELPFVGNRSQLLKLSKTIATQAQFSILLPWIPAIKIVTVYTVSTYARSSGMSPRCDFLCSRLSRPGCLHWRSFK